MDKDFESIFKNIYDKKIWGPDENLSGNGSKIAFNKPYLDFLERFIKQNNIKNIYDLGCGDFSLMKYFNLSELNYMGVDVVEDLIDKNNKLYGCSNIKFLHDDIRSIKIKTPCDLIIIKDVFIHLDNNTILQVLSNLKNYERILVTNDFNKDKAHNININNGEFRQLDINAPPLCVKAECVFEYYSKLTFKKTMLVKGKNFSANNN